MKNISTTKTNIEIFLSYNNKTGDLIYACLINAKLKLYWQKNSQSYATNRPYTFECRWRHCCLFSLNYVDCVSFLCWSCLLIVTYGIWSLSSLRQNFQVYTCKGFEQRTIRFLLAWKVNKDKLHKIVLCLDTCSCFFYTLEWTFQEIHCFQ